MTAGHIYTVAGDGGTGDTGDGGPATGASLDGPAGVAADAAGNLVVANSGDGVIRVVAASTGTFYRQAMTAGDIYRVAGGGSGALGDGGPATGARLDGPTGVAVDAAANLLIADHGNARLRVVARATSTFYGQPMVAGHIYTVAGNGSAGFSGDGGPATGAELFAPWGVAVDGSSLVTADPVNNRIRLVTG